MGSRRRDRGLGIVESQAETGTVQRFGLHGAGYLLPRLRVKADAEDRLAVTGSKPLGPRDTSEAW
jgi:hypothetical protein